MLEGHLGPVRTQFVSDNLSKRRADVLSHFGAHDINQYIARAINLEPDVGRKQLGKIARG